MSELASSLLPEVKQYLRITWNNDDTMLSGVIERGAARLQMIAGVSLDFAEEALPKSLLLDYCRYANSQALEVFEANFQSELNALYLMGRLKEIDGDQNPDTV